MVYCENVDLWDLLKIQLLGIGFLKSATKHSVLDPFLE